MKKDWKDKLVQSWEPEFVVSSGSYKLDFSPALSAYNGIPAGSIVQYMSHKEGSFKTTLALAGGREMQRSTGKKLAFIDAEGGLTGIDWVKAIGVDTSEDMWTLALPDTGEEAFDMADYFIENEDYGGVIIDSIDACTPEKNLESEYGDANIGNHAKLVTGAIRKWKTSVRNNQTVLWLINQMKVNITNMGARGHTATGGKGLGFYCKLNMEMGRGLADSSLKDDIHIPLTFKVKRSKLGQSFLDIETYAIQGTGIDTDSELRDFAEQSGILIKAGSWWRLNDGKTKKDQTVLGQGSEACRAWVRENKDALIKLMKTGEIDDTLQNIQ